jgi:two-component system sensor histidine kinase KdpD
LTNAPHRIFLGYAAGVGKTYAMLAEARRRVDRGEDVVIGFLEPHLRSHTDVLAEGIERVPPKVIEYRDSEFAELNAEAVIARSPQWVLVDELAHGNVLGGGHEKRWELVEEILHAGIGVMSTLNIQHVASLSDYVFHVSGVRVTETVPDSVVRAAEVVVIDAEPDDLLARVRRGAVLPLDEVGKALTHFFSKPTLVALREKAREFGPIPVEGLERAVELRRGRASAILNRWSITTPKRRS